MAFPESMDPRSAGAKPVPNRKNVESEEEEMLHNDPAERAVSGTKMDEIAESGDRDPLIGNAVDPADKGRQARKAGDA
jgi:hypothetical protein